MFSNQIFYSQIRDQSSKREEDYALRLASVQAQDTVVSFVSKDVKSLTLKLKTDSTETPELVSEPVVNEPNVVCQPKVWSNAPIIEEYESDSEDEHESLPTEELETPSFANQQVKTPRETVKNQFTHSKNLKVNKKGLGYGFTTKACFLVLLGERGKLLLSPQQIVIRDQKDSTGSKYPNTMDYPHKALQNKGIVDSGCSRHMTGNKAYLAEYQDFNGGPVAFGGSKGGLACLIAKATINESNKWNRRLGHVNFKNLNKLVKGNLVRGLPSKIFQNDHTCVACQKGKQHKASPDSQSSSSNKKQSRDQKLEPMLLRSLKHIEMRVRVDAMQERPAAISRIQKVLDSCRTCLMGRRQLELNGFTEIRRMREELWLEIRQGYFLRDIVKRIGSTPMLPFRCVVLIFGGVTLYGKIDEEVYVSQPPGFLDPKYPQKVYKVVKALYGLHQAPRAWYATTQKPLVKDEEASDVDIHLYRSMIGSLMYLTASRPDIMFAVCACSRFQVTPKTSHLSDVKRIFRYLKGKPKLGLWYPRVSSFDLEAYSDSDYAGANLDRKSTTGGCQFLGRRLISWQCKKQTIMATSTTEAEYVAAANCCGQVLWIQNQMLDYGFNFMNTKIYIDNESTICIVKNLVYHSKTKHIAIRHHFIRDAYEKKLIQVLKIHTDDNVADLLTKAFDVSRESLGRALDGTEALLLPKLFILWLAKVSTDSAKLIPLGKDSTAIETLKKIPPRV
ncbi:putative ribonuclease H-like domain-containing protein [Tanacetum coccineum]|uniref:Ribonuclease H-like domain-containing protein n=1 Tax=Tanacetum coccineum TaxID=301880 RepID=A0ABQ5C3F7_9ASTR